VATSRPTVELLWRYILRLICSQAGLLLLRQNRKHKIVNILAYLLRLDTAVTSNDKSGFVPGNSTKHFGMAI
jgi:hypothetical protein